MEWLISNLLILARIEAGAIEFSSENQPVVLALEEAVSSLSL